MGKFRCASAISVLRDGEQGAEIAVLLHQLVKTAGFDQSTVFQHKNAVAAPQDGLIQLVRDKNAGHTGQVKQVVRHLTRRLRVERGGGLVGQKDA